MNEYPAFWYSSDRYFLLYDLRGSSELSPVKPQCFNPPLSKITPICPRLSQSFGFCLPAPNGTTQYRNQRPAQKMESTPFLVHLWCIHFGAAWPKNRSEIRPHTHLQKCCEEKAAAQRASHCFCVCVVRGTSYRQKLSVHTAHYHLSLGEVSVWPLRSNNVLFDNVPASSHFPMTFLLLSLLPLRLLVHWSLKLSISIALMIIKTL